MKVNIALLISVGVMAFFIGGIASDVGESRPSYVIEPILPIAGALCFGFFWVLGYMTRYEQEALSAPQPKGVTHE